MGLCTSQASLQLQTVIESSGYSTTTSMTWRSVNGRTATRTGRATGPFTGECTLRDLHRRSPPAIPRTPGLPAPRPRPRPRHRPATPAPPALPTPAPSAKPAEAEPRDASACRGPARPAGVGEGLAACGRSRPAGVGALPASWNPTPDAHQSHSSSRALFGEQMREGANVAARRLRRGGRYSASGQPGPAVWPG